MSAQHHVQEPVQAGSDQRSFCPTVFSPWTWGQQDIPTQLRRALFTGWVSCVPVWSPEAGLCAPGPSALGSHHAHKPGACSGSEEAVYFLLPESTPLHIAPVLPFVRRPARRRLSSPLAHASPPSTWLCRATFLASCRDPNSEKRAWEFTWGRIPGVISARQERRVQDEIRDSGEATQAYILYRNFPSFPGTAPLTLPSPQSCGEKIAKVTSWPTRPQCGLLLVVLGRSYHTGLSSFFQRSLPFVFCSLSVVA